MEEKKFVQMHRSNEVIYTFTLNPNQKENLKKIVGEELITMLDKLQLGEKIRHPGGTTFWKRVK